MLGKIKQRFAVYILKKSFQQPVMVGLFDTEKTAYEFLEAHKEFACGEVINFYEEISPTWF